MGLGFSGFGELIDHSEDVRAGVDLRKPDFFQKQCRLKQVGRYTVSMKRVRIDYTIYSPDYAPGIGECWDYRTFRGARKKAQDLGVGSLIVRNFNRNKPMDWWQSTFCWVWDGSVLSKRYSLSEKKWKVDSLILSQTSVLRRFRLNHR
jgi:hypothetical protein